MGWAVGFDENWKRDIGYGVPAYCDRPGCNTEINRGLSYVCGGEPYGGDNGCGLYFCSKHLHGIPGFCVRCVEKKDPFDAKADHPDWLHHKMTDPSWDEWRKENGKQEPTTKQEVCNERCSGRTGERVTGKHD